MRPQQPIEETLKSQALVMLKRIAPSMPLGLRYLHIGTIFILYQAILGCNLNRGNETCVIGRPRQGEDRQVDVEGQMLLCRGIPL